MSCPSCTALQARGKTCWRHPPAEVKRIEVARVYPSPHGEMLIDIIVLPGRRRTFVARDGKLLVWPQAAR